MKTKLITFSLTVITFFFIVLTFSKPSEDEFFNRIVIDYSLNHQGFELTESDLKSMGNSEYRSNILYSTYSYQFGNIKVAYWGILGRIFYSGFDKGMENLNPSNTQSVEI